MTERNGRRPRPNHRKFKLKNHYFRDTELLWKDKNTPLMLYTVAELFAADEALDQIIAIRKNFFEKLDQLRSNQ